MLILVHLKKKYSQIVMKFDSLISLGNPFSMFRPESKGGQLNIYSSVQADWCHI